MVIHDYPGGFQHECACRCMTLVMPSVGQSIIDRAAELAWALGEYESPLEEGFARCWFMVDILAMFLGGQETLSIRRQVETETGHRLDFVVGSGIAGAPRVAIELDGHQFHEKTREQVARRNERDRRLIEAGWVIVRFSGSEFFRDPLSCVTEARRLAKKAQPLHREVVHA